MGEDIKSAIDTPRPHHQLVPMKIFYEIGAKKVNLDLFTISHGICDLKIRQISGYKFLNNVWQNNAKN